MEEKGSCRFDSIPNPLTVGDIFELHCEWPLSISLSAPLRIEFYQDTNEALENSPETKSSPKAKDDESSFSNPSENPYALYLLDIINLLPGRGSFKVVSYQPGRYNTGFKIVGSQDVLHTKNLYWKVDSVIPQEKKETIAPYPAYGPWKEPAPIWYWPIATLSLLSLIAFITIKIYAYIKRKKKIKEVSNRLKNKTAFREFVSQLNLLARGIKDQSRKEFIVKLENYFRLFLENEFYIFTLKKEPRNIIRQMKKYYPHYDKENNILNFFMEMQKLSNKEVSYEDGEQLLNMARDLAIKLYQNKYNQNT